MEQDLQRELQYHLDRQISENIHTGMSADEARRQAVLRFGGLEQFKEACRDARGVTFLETLWQDIRYGLRAMRKSPGFTAIAVITLALGIGANTAIFSVVDAVLLRSLPYKDPDRILYLYGDALDTGNFADWKQQSKSYELFAAASIHDVDLTGVGEAQLVGAADVSVDYFPLWGVRPALGRGFVSTDFQPGNAHVAVVSDHLWKSLFSTDAGGVGRSLVLDHSAYTVVGVMPPDAGPFPYRGTDVWLPLLPARAKYTSALGRLKPGVSLVNAQAEAATIAAHLADGPDRGARRPLIQVWRLQDQLVDDSRLTLLLLAGAVGFVLLIACANVSNLLLARLAARRREIAVRIALGAGRGRIVRQLFMEGLLLSGMGAALGLLLAHWATHLLVFSIPVYVPRIEQSRIDDVVLAFTLLLSVIAALLFGLAPALATSAPDLNNALKQGARTQTGGPGHQRLRGTLVVIELALAMVTLTGTGLVLKEYLVLRPSRPGFDPRNKLTMTLGLPNSLAGQHINFLREATERIGILPGVSGVAAVSDLPLTGMSFVPNISIAGHVVAGIGQGVRVHYRVCTTNFFDVMAMPIVSGRDFSANDDERAPKVAVVNETTARSLWRDENPIGQRLSVDWGDQPTEFTVVGVVRDSRIFWSTISARPELYVPFWQDPAIGRMSFVVHTWNDPASAIPAVRDTLHSLNRDIVISDARTMNQLLDDSVASPRFNARLFGILGGLAAVLAMMGIYGVMTYAVSQRTHEMGVRIALGAEPRNILRMVLSQGLRLSLIGLGLGLAASFGLTRLMSGFLFGVRPLDPETFVVVTASLLAVAAVACWIPARRATRVDPMIALRYE
jgi:putative ABC transport system permease protein